jgi:hypothetical protein
MAPAVPRGPRAQRWHSSGIKATCREKDCIVNVVSFALDAPLLSRPAGIKSVECIPIGSSRYLQLRLIRSSLRLRLIKPNMCTEYEHDFNQTRQRLAAWLAARVCGETISEAYEKTERELLWELKRTQMKSRPEWTRD